MLRKVFPSSLGSMERSFVTREQCLGVAVGESSVVGLWQISAVCALRWKSVYCAIQLRLEEKSVAQVGRALGHSWQAALQTAEPQ